MHRLVAVFAGGAHRYSGGTVCRRRIRFTCKGDTVYAIALVCPEDGMLRIRSMRKADASHLPLFSGAVKDVTVLGRTAPIVWERDTTALRVDMGAYRSDLPVVIKIKVN